MEGALRTRHSDWDLITFDKLFYMPMIRKNYPSIEPVLLFFKYIFHWVKNHIYMVTNELSTLIGIRIGSAYLTSKCM